MNLEKIITDALSKIALTVAKDPVEQELEIIMKDTISETVMRIKAEVLDYIIEQNKLNQPLAPVVPIAPVNPNPYPIAPWYPVNPWYPYHPYNPNMNPWDRTIYYTSGTTVSPNGNSSACTGTVGCQCLNCKPK